MKRAQLNPPKPKPARSRIAPIVSLRRALTDKKILGNSLVGSSWHNWRAMLLASMGEPLLPNELAAFRQFTSRDTPPPQRVEEALFAIGRRGGKDEATATLSAYLAGCVNWSPVLSRGERGLVACIAPDQRQARIQRDRVEGVLDASPILSRMVIGKSADSIDLNNRISIEVRAASFRRLRGITNVAVICSEAAFWQSDESSSNPDSEILNAVRPSLATTGGPLIIITSPYARRGEVWNLYKNHFGPNGDPLVLVAQGSSRDFNPTLSQAFIQRQLDRDPATASAEYLAVFRTDIESFISRESVEACVIPNLHERPPISGTGYVGAIDPSGGSIGGDSMTLAISHDDRDGKVILDLVKEFRPPFSPQAVVEDFCKTLKSYGVTNVVSDHWGDQFVAEPFRVLGITLERAEKPKSDYYRDLLPTMNSGKIELLDNARLINQLCNLERKTARSGKDSIDHPPGQHDDLINSAALALITALNGGSAIALWNRFGASWPVNPRDMLQRSMFAHFNPHLGGYNSYWFETFLKEHTYA
jgi:hypothetical protein